MQRMTVSSNKKFCVYIIVDRQTRINNGGRIRWSFFLLAAVFINDGYLPAPLHQRISQSQTGNACANNGCLPGRNWFSGWRLEPGIVFVMQYGRSIRFLRGSFCHQHLTLFTVAAYLADNKSGLLKVSFYKTGSSVCAAARTLTTVSSNVLKQLLRPHVRIFCRRKTVQKPGINIQPVIYQCSTSIHKFVMNDHAIIK